MYKSLEAGQALCQYQVTTTDCDLMKTAHFGNKVIVDGVLVYASCVQSLLLLWHYNLQVFLRHRASIKIKKYRIMPDALEFVGILLSREGNKPA
jgi:hypothetical protein